MSLFEKIKRLCATPKAVSIWINARELCSERNFEEALQQLQKIEPMLAGHDVEYHLMRGGTRWELKDYEHVIEDARTAMRLIPDQSRYNDEEKKYLYAHAQIMLARALLDLGKKAESDQILLQCEIPSIKLGRVSKGIKLNFPCREHPDWAQDMGKV